MTRSLPAMRTDNCDDAPIKVVKRSMAASTVEEYKSFVTQKSRDLGKTDAARI